MPRKRLTPQEKKVRSYQKDRRNRYRENDKASRKLIPARMARVNRVFRRDTRQALLLAWADIEDSERQLDRVKRRRWRSWRKFPDETLAERLAKGDSFRRQGLSAKRDDKRGHRRSALARLAKSGRPVDVRPLRVQRHLDEG